MVILGGIAMPRRGENIYKRKDGRWEGRYIKGYNENGKALYKSVYAHNYADIKSKLNQYFCQNAEIKNNNILLSAYADQWLNSVKLGRKISTYNKYRSIYDLHIKPFIGNCRIGYICNDHIDKIIAACSELSPKTVNDILCVVKMLFEYIRINGGDLNICMKGLGIRQEYKQMRVLTICEQRKLTSVLLCDTDYHKLGVYLALCTGIRIGELCALKRENISFETKLLYVRSTMQRVQVDNLVKKTEVIITAPKSKKSVRDIPLPSFIFEICRKYYEHLAPSDFLLTGTSDYMEPRSLQYHFKKYIKESGLENVHFHSLRHTFATRCVENDFEIKTLSEILGHVNVNITLNRYVHSSIELKRSNMEKLNCIL